MQQQMPILLSSSPEFETKTITTGRGKKKKSREIIVRIRAGAPRATWGWPGSNKEYRSRKAAIKGGA